VEAKTEVEATSILPSLNGKTARSCRGILPFTHLAREGRMTVTIGRRELLVALGLHELVPAAATIAILLNPKNPDSEDEAKDVQEAARTLGVQILVLNAGTESEIDAAFTKLVEQRVGALMLGADTFFTSQRTRLATLSTYLRIPTADTVREFADAGGLVSYGASLAGVYRQAGVYAGRILKGDKPSDLPVQLPTAFELVINLKTAKTLGLEVPPGVSARADEVIE
jgi:putative ABC transport system substrate-binding protein